MYVPKVEKWLCDGPHIQLWALIIIIIGIPKLDGSQQVVEAMAVQRDESVPGQKCKPGGPR